MGRYALRRSEGTPGLVAAGVATVVMTAVFVVGGTYSTVDLPGWTWSARELIGMSLMLTGATTYLIAAWTIAQRRSLELVAELRPLLPDPSAADEAVSTIQAAWGRTWWIGSLVGIGLSLFNTNPIWAFTGAAYTRIAVPVSFGQIFLWMVIGNLLAVRITASHAFARLGERVRIDLFRLDRLRPLARSGVVDAALVVGALLFAPLQSLDFEFRAGNYSFALIVALPSLAFYLYWPLHTVHRRIRTERDGRLMAVDLQIEQLGSATPSTPVETERLEVLLAHRERLADARTWPLDLSILSRIAFYLVIPPLAWAAAAVVERIVDGLLAGS